MVRISARSGPTAGAVTVRRTSPIAAARLLPPARMASVVTSGRSRSRGDPRRDQAATGAGRSAPRSRLVASPLLLAPAVGEAVRHALRGDARHGLCGDQVHARVGVAGGLLAGLGVLDDRRDAE